MILPGMEALHSRQMTAEEWVVWQEGRVYTLAPILEGELSMITGENVRAGPDGDGRLNLSRQRGMGL